MKSRRRWLLAVGVALVVRVADCGWSSALADENKLVSPEGRAVAFLSVEVPRWHAENACYSCHNNGDAARAIILARQRGLLAEAKPLEDTLRFLAMPERWDANGPDGPFKDTKLARIQFAAALTDATAAGLVTDRQALQSAAALVAELQTADGHWETDAEGTLGSPATYGRSLATVLALRTLRAADERRYGQQIARAREWLLQSEPKSVLDAAALMWALADDRTEAARRPRERALAIVRTGQSDDGGWGPFVSSPPEVFDSALVVIALASQRDAAFEELIARGRNYLLARQQSDGSWPATTRPAGVDSYAQKLSTTGWATQALLVSQQNQGATSSRAQKE